MVLVSACPKQRVEPTQPAAEPGGTTTIDRKAGTYREGPAGDTRNGVDETGVAPSAIDAPAPPAPPPAPEEPGPTRRP